MTFADCISLSLVCMIPTLAFFTAKFSPRRCLYEAYRGQAYIGRCRRCVSKRADVPTTWTYTFKGLYNTLVACTYTMA